MLNLNPFAISGLLITATYLPLFLILTTRRRIFLVQVYSFHILGVLAWGICSFLIGISSNPETSFTLWKISFLVTIFIPVFFLQSVLIIRNQRSNWMIPAAYLLALFFSYLNFEGKFSKGMKLMFSELYCPQGTIYYVFAFIFWILIVSISQISLISTYRTTYPNDKKQIILLNLSLIGFLGGILNFLPTFGINLYPYGNFLIPIHSLIVTYAILKHHLWDIKLVIKKSLVYSILISAISLLYVTVIVVFEKQVSILLQYDSPLISASAAFILGIIFIPLKNIIQNSTDKLFFHGTQPQIAEENVRLRQEVAETERLKSISILASGLAHEIRNPLTAIQTFAEYLPKKINDKEFLLKFSAIAHKEVSRINSLINQLLDFAKPAPLQIKNVNVNQLISETLTLLNSNFLTRHIAIEEHLDANPAELQADPNQLKQALLNVLLNAVDAMPQGGTITIETGHRSSATSKALPLTGAPSPKQNFGRPAPLTQPQNPTHDCEPRTPTPALTITITDTGKGISKQDLPHIFDPFFSKKDSGTGLGLAVTHGIIQQHGGKIFVESEAGKGTRFRMEMPAVRQGVGGRESKKNP